jgi:H3 lysine-79-specific histone-lysine N-methyltransferase
MYGGVKENLVELVIEKTMIGKDDQFLDIGSGIGQICIQVAATVGCKTLGFELIQERNDAGNSLLKNFDSILEIVCYKIILLYI